MKLKNLYLGLCVLGTVLPYSQFLPFLREHGLNVPLMMQQLFVNHISGFFALDVLVSAVVLCIFIRAEGRRASVPGLWMPVAATLTVGVSLGFPLFLYLREARREASS